MDPEMARLFHASTSVSTSNGTAYHLFKETAKRRRTKMEIEADNLREAEEKLRVEMKLKQFEEMEASCAKMQEQIQNQMGLLDQAQNLYNLGLLKQDG